jgi:hypothetical protein
VARGCIEGIYPDVIITQQIPQSELHFSVITIVRTVYTRGDLPELHFSVITIVRTVKSDLAVT